MNCRDLWMSLSEGHQNFIIKRAKQRQWKRLFEEKGKEIGLASYDEAKKIGVWCQKNILEKEEKPVEEAAPKENFEVDAWEHNQTYWYDDKRDVYVVHLPSQKRPLAIPASKWKSIRAAYSNWDGSPSSINEICRKHGLARRTVTELLRAMGVTHGSAPWTDEEMQNTNELNLIEDLLRKKEERVLVKSQQKEWNKIKKDADKYRRWGILAEETYTRLMQSSEEYSVRQLELSPAKEPYAVVISPTDFHWGKYAPEYAGDVYNREIAKQRLFKSTKALLSRLTERGKPDRIFLALGGDGLHIDNQSRTTTKGTLQDCDGTPEELAWSWVELCREYVDFVRQVAPVTLFVIAGNHDYYTATLLRAAMKGWFHRTDNVEIVESLLNRQYTVYGNNLLAFLHGDIGSTKDWPAIIAGEEREKWGSTEHKAIFTGHLHTERELPTFGNVVVYRMPSLAGTDAWHASKGYKSRKALVAYLVSHERGVIAQEIEPVK